MLEKVKKKKVEDMIKKIARIWNQKSNIHLKKVKKYKRGMLVEVNKKTSDRQVS